MSDELDVNKIVSEFMTANIDEFSKKCAGFLKESFASVKSRLTTTYGPYLKRIFARHSKSKSFFIRSQPIPIYDFFVAPDVSNELSSIETPDALSLGKVASAVQIVGSGGCGKTMLMKHFLVSSILTKARVPVLVELRSMNSPSQNLLETILTFLNANGLSADEKFLTTALRSGMLLLLLDGFDEIDVSRRTEVAREIQHINEMYPKTWIFITSRPDTTLDGWVNFTQYQIMPFDMTKAVELVKKLPFDEPVKNSFIASLQRDLYQQHKSFLSNPLLISIMLLTYCDVAHIPTKLSAFYNNAFESLFQRHDALKGGYQRTRKSPLDIQDFGRAFAAFCIRTYDRKKFSFSRTEALEHLEEAKNLSGLTYQSDHVLFDAIQAVCLMIEDGTQITFAHRSFQEYFTATFIRSAPAELKARLIERISEDLATDQVIQLLLEIDQDAVEKFYILPRLRRLEELIKLKRKVGMSHFLRFIKLSYKSFAMRKRADVDDRPSLFATIRDPKLHNLLMLIFRNYIDTKKSNDVELRTDIVSSLCEELHKLGFADDSTILTETFTAKTPFAQLLFSFNHWWGGKGLMEIIQLRKDIERRHHAATRSLNEILRGA